MRRSGVKPGLVYYLLNKPRGIGHHRQGHARPADGGRARAGRAAGVLRRAARRRHRGVAAAHQRRRTRAPHQLIPATASRRSTSPTSRGRVSPGALRRLRDGVELEDGMTAEAQVSQPSPGRAADHDPRGPQPPGAPDVRGGRASRAAAGADPDRTDQRSLVAARRLARALDRRAAGADGGGRRRGAPVRSTDRDRRRSSSEQPRSEQCRPAPRQRDRARARRRFGRRRAAAARLGGPRRGRHDRARSNGPSSWA